MKRILVILLAGILVFSFGCKKGKKQANNQQQQDTVSFESATLPFDQESPFDSVATDVDTTQNDQVMAVDTQTNKIKPVSDNVVKQNPGNIYIIVGSFKVYQNAVKTKNYYEHLGYQPQILPQVAGLNRVALESYTDLSQARKRLAILRKKFNRHDFWLLYNKDNQ